MGIIRIPFRFEGSIGEKTVYALFDSWPTFFLPAPGYSCSNRRSKTLRRAMEAATASEGHFVKINEAMRVDFYYGDIRLSDEFMIVPGLSE